AHLERGLALVDRLAEGLERDHRELGLRVVLGPCLIALKAHAAPDVGECYARARELCARLGDTPALVPVLYGLWVYELALGHHRLARPLAEQCLRSALASGDPHLKVPAFLWLGCSQMFMGEAPAAREHLEQALALFDPERDGPLIVTYGLDVG